MASHARLAAAARFGRRCCCSLSPASAASTRLSHTASSLHLSSAARHLTRRTVYRICRPTPARFGSSAASAAASSTSAVATAASVSQRLQSAAASSPSSPLPVVVECACSGRPHPDKKEGEDTFSMHASPSAVTVAVYDGVGSWSFEQGVDVSLFSKRIKQLTDELLAADSSSSAALPVALLESVWRRLSADRVLGSCTACIVSLSASPAGCRLDAVTLGDSGFLVLRKRRQGEEETDATETVDESSSELSVITAYSADSYEQQQQQQQHSSAAASSAQLPYYVHYRSLQQLHYFNCPFQLGFTADSIDQPPSSSTASAAASPFDLPSSALSSSLSLLADDVVVLSSDGLFDNVDERSIVQLVSAALTGGRSVAELSDSLASAAFERSVDRRVDGPFAAAAKDHNILWSGGRKDDITVIVARIAQQQQQQQQPGL